jgi:hypothetical protein
MEAGQGINQPKHHDLAGGNLASSTTEPARNVLSMCLRVGVERRWRVTHFGREGFLAMASVVAVTGLMVVVMVVGVGVGVPMYHPSGA